jgi:predicted esterase
MKLDSPEVHTFPVRLDCRYLLHVPETIDEHSVLVLTLHGYGANPESMLRLTAGLLGNGHPIAALQGPNEHYQNAPAANAMAGYNWGIRDHWQSAVRLHHEMVLRAFESLRDRFQIPAARCLLMGFSQSVGMNYRFMGTHPGQAGGVMGICGGVPRDWEEEKYAHLGASILHISRDQDEFYPVEVSAQFADRLRKHAGDVEHHLLPGGHRFPSKAHVIARPWMARVFGDGKR